MPDGETKAGVSGGDVGPGEAKSDGLQPLSAIEQRELRRQARTPMTEEQLKLWTDLATERQEKFGLAGEDYMPI